MAGAAGCGVCVTGRTPTRYDQAVCEDQFVDVGSEFLIHFHCSVAFNTTEGGIMDINVWNNYIAPPDGEDPYIFLTPCGALDFGDESQDELFRTGCGTKKYDIGTVPITFETCQGAQDKSDERWWYKYHKRNSQYTTGWLSCDGCVYFGEATTAAILDDGNNQIGAGNIGYNVSILNKPRKVVGPGGRGKAGLWRFTGEYNSSCVERGVEIPLLSTALAAA